MGKRQIGSGEPTDQVNRPASGGAVSVSSVQYNALVPGHGESPRTPRARTVPAESQTAMGMPVRAHPADDFAPTLTVNGRSVTTG